MLRNIPNVIKALKEGFNDAGIQKVTNFPGFYSHILFEELGGKNISLNERSAYAEAFGSSLAGLRTVVSFKNVGLSIASDAFLHSLISGVNGGLVVVVTDDVEVWGSQERQDSRPFIMFNGGLWFEPRTIQQAYDFAYNSFELSEKFDVPIVIRLTNQVFNLLDEHERSPKIIRRYTKKIVKNRSKNIVHPVYWMDQYKRLINKNRIIRRYVNRLVKLPRRNFQKCIISLGNCDKELSNLNLNEFDVMYVNTYPLPIQKIREFVMNREEIHVFEQGTSFGCDFLSKLISEKIKLLSNTGNIPDLSSTYYKWDKYEKFFKALKKVKPDYVIGDVTQFTVENTDTIDACLSLGVSLSTTIGLLKNKKIKYPFCIVGDCSLLHEGIDLIHQAFYEKNPIGLIIFNNGGSWCTGGQSYRTSIRRYSKEIPTTTVNYDDCSEDHFFKILQKMKKNNQFQILIINISMGKFRIKS